LTLEIEVRRCFWMKQPDFLVIGEGIIGVSVARSLQKRFESARVPVLEKERFFGVRSGGRETSPSQPTANGKAFRSTSAENWL
jgi:glycine/D-amino acid oxidase-like deaminating enzyme